MQSRKTARDCRKTCLETLKGLQTLIQMQQTLIVQAMRELDDEKGESTVRKKSGP